MALPIILNAQSKYGTSAAPFLTIGIGARATAMGGAFTAEANDISALYWNPAGISKLQGTEVAFSHSTYLVNTTIDWAAFTTNLGGYGSIGAAVTVLNYGQIERTTEVQPDGTGQFFTPQDLAIQLTYAKAITDRFAIGGSVKYIHQSILSESASTVALDLGVLFITPMGLRIGATMSNFGGSLAMDGEDLLGTTSSSNNENGANNGIPTKLVTDSWALPLTFRVGAAYDAFNSGFNRVTFAMDALHPNDNAESINAGAEYSFHETLFIRGGYNALFLANSETGLTLGAGFNYELSGIKIKIDYTYLNYNRLNYVQWFNVGLKF